MPSVISNFAEHFIGVAGIFSEFADRGRLKLCRADVHVESFREFAENVRAHHHGFSKFAENFRKFAEDRRAQLSIVRKFAEIPAMKL